MYIKVASSDDAQKLANSLKDGNWMVLYYAEWCGHCQQMKPEWQKVITSSAESPQFNIADIESTHIAEMPNKPAIQGFPTIKMYNNGREVANFQDDRVANKIKRFAISNSKVVAAKPKTHHNLDSPLVKLLAHAPSKLPKLSKPKHYKITKAPAPSKKSSSTKSTKSITKPCTSIMSAKICKSNPKCYINYKTKKCQSKTSIKRGVKGSKSSRKSSPKSIKNTTTNVFAQLIKSFKRIGNEAEKDATLLRKATKKL
jgi:hypothetical protein